MTSPRRCESSCRCATATWTRSGHVNQAVYHELLEEVRAAFFRHTLPDLPFTGYVLAHVELDYRREVRIEDRYLIGECRVAELGRSRVELDNRLLLPDGDVAVEGRAVLVAWDEQSRKSRELTAARAGGAAVSGARATPPVGRWPPRRRAGWAPGHP